MRETLVLLSLLITLFSKSLGSLFAKELSLNKERRLEIELSTEGMNRVSLNGDRITKLVFQENTLQIEAESHDGSLFIAPRMPRDSKVYATLFTEKGFVQELVFHIKKDCDPVTVLLSQRAVRPLKRRKASRTFSKTRKASKRDDSKKILNLLKAVIEGRLLGRKAKNFCKDKGVSFEDVTVFQKNKFTVTAIKEKEQSRLAAQRSEGPRPLRSKALGACFGKVRATTAHNDTLYVVSDL